MKSSLSAVSSAEIWLKLIEMSTFFISDYQVELNAVQYIVEAPDEAYNSYIMDFHV